MKDSWRQPSAAGQPYFSHQLCRSSRLGPCASASSRSAFLVHTTSGVVVVRAAGDAALDVVGGVGVVPGGRRVDAAARALEQLEFSIASSKCVEGRLVGEQRIAGVRRAAGRGCLAAVDRGQGAGGGGCTAGTRRRRSRAAAAPSASNRTTRVLVGAWSAESVLWWFPGSVVSEVVRDVGMPDDDVSSGLTSNQIPNAPRTSTNTPPRRRSVSTGCPCRGGGRGPGGRRGGAVHIGPLGGPLVGGGGVWNATGRRLAAGEASRRTAAAWVAAWAAVSDGSAGAVGLGGRDRRARHASRPRCAAGSSRPDPGPVRSARRSRPIARSPALA